MRYPLMMAVVSGLSIFPTLTQAAGVEVGLGVDSFAWTERDSGGNKIVEERGPRMSLTLSVRPPQNQQAVQFSYFGKAYLSAAVDYRGSTFSGQKLESETRYRGMANELRANMQGDFTNYLFGFGWESWRRAIYNPLMGKDQLENFNVVYMRAGLDSKKDHDHGLHWGLGVKYPLYIHEDAHLTTIGYRQNPSLTPGKKPTFYWELGYKIPGVPLDIVGSYETFNMPASGSVIVTDNATGAATPIQQPHSKMQVFNMRWMYQL